MTVRRILVAGLGALALALCAPGVAAAELKAIWGPNHLPDGRSAFPTYKELHVQVLERQLQWNQVAKTRPRHPRNPHDSAYTWPATVDFAAVQARRHGMRLALMIKGSPGWANGGHAAGWAPHRPRDYANFAIAAARHYRHVRLWMVWGEPALPNNFEPMAPHYRAGARRYARLLDRAYGALKSVRRSNIVIGGDSYDSQLPSIAKYLHWLRLPNGKPPRLDWWSHNPYGTRYPRLSKPTYNPTVRDMSDVDTLIREVRRVYRRIHRRPRLWLSEFNVQSDHWSWAFEFFVNRHQQAHWLTAAYRIAHREHYIAGLGWFELLDQNQTDTGLSGGIMDSLGRPKPSWYAYRRAP